MSKRILHVTKNFPVMSNPARKALFHLLVSFYLEAPSIRHFFLTHCSLLVAHYSSLVARSSLLLGGDIKSAPIGSGTYFNTRASISAISGAQSRTCKAPAFKRACSCERAPASATVTPSL